MNVMILKKKSQPISEESSNNILCESALVSINCPLRLLIWSNYLYCRYLHSFFFILCAAFICLTAGNQSCQMRDCDRHGNGYRHLCAQVSHVGWSHLLWCRSHHHRNRWPCCALVHVDAQRGGSAHGVECRGLARQRRPF